MSWELRVWTPDKAALRATYTDAAPGGIVHGFRWSVRGDGNCEQLRFSAKPSAVDIQARDIVQLLVDGQPAFYGYIETSWPAQDGLAREYVAVGASEIFRERVVGYDPLGSGDVAQLAQRVFIDYAAPQVDVPSPVKLTGMALSVESAAAVNAHKALDDLAASAGVTWGVDATGTAFFNAPATHASAGYEEHGLRWLPVEGEDVVTEVFLISGLDRNPIEIDGDTYTPEFMPGAPSLAMYRYAVPENSTYRASRAYAYQDGVLERRAEVDRYTSYNATNPANAFDGNRDTYAENGSDDQYMEITGYYSAPTYGALVLVEVVPAATELLGVYVQNCVSPVSCVTGAHRQVVHGPAVVPVWVWAPMRDGITGSSVYVYLGGGVTALDIGSGGTSGGTTTDPVNPGDLRIRRIEAFTPKNLASYARSLIHLPSQAPAEVTWDGYHPPARNLTITGSVAGDLTGEVETWEYELTPRRLVSRARLGSRGADEAARAIRILADRRRQEAEGTTLALTRRR